MKTINLYIKHNYGAEYAYVKDEKMAKPIRQLTGQKTVSRGHIKALKDLGFNFRIVTNTDIIG